MTYVFVEISRMYWILNELCDEFLHLQFTRSVIKINQNVSVLTKLYPLSIFYGGHLGSHLVFLETTRHQLYF